MATAHAITRARVSESPQVGGPKRNPYDLRLTRSQFRRFAEIAKSRGYILEVHEPWEKPGVWGECGYMAMTAINDVTDPHSRGSEHGYISLATRINAREMSATSRPEIDLSAVPLHLAYEFVLWHEIGHKEWNFSLLDFIFARPGEEKYDRYYAKMRRINEVLADRYAWERLFPGKPMPVRKDLTFVDRRRIELDIEELEEGLGPLTLKERKPLPAGQYKVISTKMLATPKMAAWAGPKALVQAPHWYMRRHPDQGHLVTPATFRAIEEGRAW